MSTIVKWNKSLSAGTYFDDLLVGRHFIILSQKAGGVVYRKVKLVGSDRQEIGCVMEEVATGTCFPPTTSRIQEVDVTIAIAMGEPAIYRSLQ